jgi:hypothetical protein
MLPLILTPAIAAEITKIFIRRWAKRRQPVAV